MTIQEAMRFTSTHPNPLIKELGELLLFTETKYRALLMMEPICAGGTCSLSGHCQGQTISGNRHVPDRAACRLGRERYAEDSATKAIALADKEPK